MSVGLAGAVLAVLWFSRIGVHSDYWPHIFPAEEIMSLGMGLVFVPVNNTALTGVAPSDAGVASALINTTQQIGGSIGTALLNTIAATATVTYLHARGLASAPAATTGPVGSRTAATVTSATVHGYSVAFLFSAGILALALVTVAVLIDAEATSTEPTIPLVADAAATRTMTLVLVPAN